MMGGWYTGGGDLDDGIVGVLDLGLRHLSDADFEGLFVVNCFHHGGCGGRHRDRVLLRMTRITKKMRLKSYMLSELSLPRSLRQGLIDGCLDERAMRGLLCGVNLFSEQLAWPRCQLGRLGRWVWDSIRVADQDGERLRGCWTWCQQADQGYSSHVMLLNLWARKGKKKASAEDSEMGV